MRSSAGSPMSSDKPAAPAAESTPPPTKPAAARTGRGRIRLLVALALAASAAGGYLYWKLQQDSRPPPVAAFDAAPRQVPAAPADESVAAPSSASPPPVESSPAESFAAAPVPDAPPAEPAVEEPPSLAGDLPMPPPEPTTDAPMAEEAPTQPPDATPTGPDHEALLARIAELETKVAELAAAPPPLTADASALAIAEAGDLVALAEQRLALARDLSGATAALRLAASRLASGEFPAQRRAILADLAALEAFHDVDVAALAAELASLARQAVRLPLAGPAPLADDATAPTPVTGWREVLAAVWSALRGLVEVREADATRDPLLNPAHAALARQQLALDLTAARVAILQRDAGELRAALGPALDALQTQFDGGDPAVAAALQRLQALGTEDLAPPLPSLARSVDALAVAPPATRPPPSEHAL